MQKMGLNSGSGSVCTLFSALSSLMVFSCCAFHSTCSWSIFTWAWTRSDKSCKDKFRVMQGSGAHSILKKRSPHWRGIIIIHPELSLAIHPLNLGKCQWVSSVDWPSSGHKLFFRCWKQPNAQSSHSQIAACLMLFWSDEKTKRWNAQLYQKIRKSKNGNSLFSVKDMHCWPVLRYL